MAGKGTLSRMEVEVPREMALSLLRKWQEENRLVQAGLSLGKTGSAQESVEGRILSCFPEDDKFGLGGRHALRFQQEVTEILIAAASP